MLDISELHAGYGDLRILHDISLSLEKGQIMSIVGSNGAGKTTLLKTISGLIKPYSGTVSFNGRDITALPAHRVAELGIVYVPEGRKLFGRLSVLDNLLVGSYAKRARRARARNLALALEMFPVLSDRRHQRAGTLSGGEQQMLAIARGLMASPQVFLLDEPSLGIAPVIVDRIFETIVRLKELGLTILLSEQNVRRALAIADRGIVIQTGRIVMQGKADGLLQSETIRRAYLGM